MVSLCFWVANLKLNLALEVFDDNDNDGNEEEEKQELIIKYSKTKIK